MKMRTCIEEKRRDAGTKELEKKISVVGKRE